MKLKLSVTVLLSIAESCSPTRFKAKASPTCETRGRFLTTQQLAGAAFTLGPRNVPLRQSFASSQLSRTSVSGDLNLDLGLRRRSFGNACNLSTSPIAVVLSFPFNERLVRTLAFYIDFE
jgi:hypothetical protein